MKKRILILMASFLLIFTATYAHDNNSKIPERIVYEFNRDFFGASNVNWQVTGSYYKASFDEHGKTLYAFYTDDAGFIGVTHSLLSDRLPVSLQSELKTKYSDYWITDLIQFNMNNQPGYYITLQNAGQKIILKSERGQHWQFYTTVEKF
jgi:hypothetical protein